MHIFYSNSSGTIGGPGRYKEKISIDINIQNYKYHKHFIGVLENVHLYQQKHIDQ